MNSSREPVGASWEGTLSPSTHCIIGSYLSAIVLVSLASNGVMLAILSKKDFRQPVNLFLVSFVMSNFIQTVIGMPMSAAANFAHRWLFGKAGCMAYGFLMYVSLLNNLATLTVVGIYRYIYLFQTQARGVLHSRKLIQKMILGTWIYACFWGVLPLLGWGWYGLEPTHTSCSIEWTRHESWNRSYLVVMSLFVFILPMIIICVVYSKIFKRTVLQLHARVSNSSINPSPVSIASPDNSATGVGARIFSADAKGQKTRIEARLTKIITINVALFCLSCVPYGVLSFVSSTGIDLPTLLTAIPCLIIKTQCAFMPFIYFSSHDQYRDHACRLLKAALIISLPFVQTR